MIYIGAIRDLLHWNILRYWLLAVGITTLGFILLFGTLFGGLFFTGLEIHSWASTATGLSLPGWLLNPLWGVFIGLITVASWFATTYFFSVLLLLVLGFFTAPIVRQIHLLYYPQVQLAPGGSLFDDMMALIIIGGRYLLWLLLLLLLSIPLFPLAPLMLSLWSLMLLRRLLLADVASQIDSKMDRKERRKGMWLASIIAYGLSLVPLLNLAAPIYGVVVISHLMLQRRRDEQQSEVEIIDPDEITANQKKLAYRSNARTDEASGD